MEYVKRNVPVYQQGNTIFDQFYLNEDVNVADAKPDVRRVIHTDGVMKVEELKKVENYIRAVVKTYIFEYVYGFYIFVFGEI